MRGHIDKLSKHIGFEIEKKPIGAIQWDFICSIPEARESLLKNYEIGPESLFLYLTNRCSLNCNTCNNDKKIYELKLDIIRKALEEEKSKKLKYVVLDGDPLLSKNIYSIIKIINDLGLSYSINTFKCPQEEFLIKVQNTIAKIQFKMQDLENKEYNEQVIKGLQLCNKYNIYTAIIFTINNTNYNNIKEMIEFCKKYNVKQFSFSRLSFCPNYSKLESFIDSKKYLDISKKLVEYRDKESNIHITSNDAIWKGCGACGLTATIYPNGDIFPCAYLKIKCGNLENGIENCWKSEVFDKIRKSELNGKCERCRYNLLCKGCRALAYIDTNNYQAEDPGCWLEGENINE